MSKDIDRWSFYNNLHNQQFHIYRTLYDLVELCKKKCANVIKDGDGQKLFVIMEDYLTNCSVDNQDKINVEGRYLWTDLREISKYSMLCDIFIDFTIIAVRHIRFENIISDIKDSLSKIEDIVQKYDIELSYPISG